MSGTDLKEHAGGLAYLADRYKAVVEDLKKKAAAQNYPHDLVLAYCAVLRELRALSE
jgi:hypothetical protein